MPQSQSVIHTDDLVHLESCNIYNPSALLSTPSVLQEGTHCGNSSTGGVLTVLKFYRMGTHCGNSSTGWVLAVVNSSTGWVLIVVTVLRRGPHCLKVLQKGYSLW